MGHWRRISLTARVSCSFLGVMSAITIEPADETASTSPAPANVEWSQARRTSFRFLCSYFLLYFYPEKLDSFIFFDIAPFSKLHEALWVPILRLAGRILALPGGVDSASTVGGDTTFNYVRLLCVFCFAVVATAIWTAVDKRRKNYVIAEDILKIAARYTLAITMLAYGLSKVFKNQFPTPSPFDLLKPLGELTPMGFLWNFMGTSTPYTIFGGAMEVLGAVLLMFQRTTTLGALVTAGVMTNVVMLNLCYDVPVKLDSSHLLLCAIALAAADMRRLLAVFLLNRPTGPLPPRKRLPKPWMENVRLGIKVVVLGGTFVTMTTSELDRARAYGLFFEPPPLYGAYDVVVQVQDGKTVPPLATDAQRFRHLSIVSAQAVIFDTMTGERKIYAMKLDNDKKTISFKPFGPGDDPPMELRFDTPSADRLDIEGTLEGIPTRLEMQKVDPSKMILINRGFHWVNEQPFG